MQKIKLHEYEVEKMSFKMYVDHFTAILKHFCKQIKNRDGNKFSLKKWTEGLQKTE